MVIFKIVQYSLSTSILLMVLIGSAVAGEHYVSPSGTASWSQCTSSTNSCSATTAMTNAAAGDTVYFLDGKYEVSQGSDYKTPALNPSQSGTSVSPIVFKSLNPLKANINGTGNNYTTASAYVSTIIGANGRNYIVWDGFLLTARDSANTKNIYATARFQASTGGVIKNCELVGGIHSQGGASNNAGVFFEASTYLIIENNKLHGYLESSNNINNTAIVGYDCSYVTVKNNDIYNSNIGIRFKDNIDDSIIENNYIHDNYMGIFISNDNDGACERNTVRNNVIAKNSYEGIEVPANGVQKANDLVINNNTFYGNTSVAIEMGQTDPGHYPKIFNNIISGSIVSMNVKGVGNQIAECDHNQWTDSFKIVTHKYETNTVTYTNLATWQNSAQLEGGRNPGVGSLASNPLFANTSGSFNQLADFRLAINSSAKGAGRNSVDIGANIDLVIVKMPSISVVAPPTGLTITK